MLKKVVSLIGGDPNKREIEKHAELVGYINELEPQFEAMTIEQLSEKTDEFRSRMQAGETLEDILTEAFATVREVSKRTIGLRHYDVQLIGGISLHQGKIVEMRTGEGKTLVATLPLYLNGLSGKGAHLVTVNDYLARRDARWMAPIYNTLGLSVGVLQMAARTEHGKKAFLVDLERESPHEDQHQLVMVPRREAYAADITYGTNNEFGFDYLRDNMALSLDNRSQRGHHYAIIDEVDNVLIDEARTPLIISGPSHDDAENYVNMARVVKQLKHEDYEVNEKDRNVVLSEIGEVHVETILGRTLRDPERPGDITPEQARIMGYLEQALRAQFLFKRNKEYLVQGGKVVIVDEFTGRLMPGRRWSDGLHQAVEAKEGVRVQSENVTYATITIQNYFRMYQKLSGMTGTALTEAEEFHKIYELEVLAIPPNVEYIATRPDSPLLTLEAKDEYNYKYTYYSRVEDLDKNPLFWKRKDYPDVVFRTNEAKRRAIVQEILTYHVIGRPILVGTTSVEHSEQLSARLRAEPVRRLAQTLILRKKWMEQHNRVEDGRAIQELMYLNEPLEKLKTGEMRQLARELGISINPEEESNVASLIDVLYLSPDDSERLVAALKGGISHQVLNARKHTEESQIIAGAGAFGAVTLATNMAGRGVDIKLGGEVAEQLLSAVNRVLKRAGYEDAYDMILEAKRDALMKVDPAHIGIYNAEIKYFLQFMENMGKVKKLGGLHVIGSERHEARRIDNQLRGRSARQGDPGSSRFYLAMDDELMRLFGGQQVDSLMQRMGMDDSIPLEANIVARIIEQSQTRVEGANFDTRKHLLDYDDVLNSQRNTIYEQRDRIFIKDDLSEDVREMLQIEVTNRVPNALTDEEGPWKLLAWLEQIQPTIIFNGLVFPSFTYKLLLEHLNDQNPTTKQEVLASMLELAENAIQAEEEHLLYSVSKILDRTYEHMEAQLTERMDMLDVFFEELRYADETEMRGPRELVNDLSGLLRLPLKLSNAQMQSFKVDLDETVGIVRDQIETLVTTQTLIRLVGSIDRRLEETLDINILELTNEDWESISAKIIASINNIYQKRQDRLLGHDGQISKDLNSVLSRMGDTVNDVLLINLLMQMTQGARTTFDKRTHRRVTQRTTRLRYVYFAANFIQDQDPEEFSGDVLTHLENAQGMIQKTWGMGEWKRLQENNIDDLKPSSLNGLVQILGEDVVQGLKGKPLSSIDASLVPQVIDELGRQGVTEIYRQLLLRVISDLWIDYLTHMEALRVSIGLEAYAQRDPLVQYKTKAYQMFQNLFSDMRMSVINRMFTFRPQTAATRQTPQSSPTDSRQAPTEEQKRPTTTKKKKKRRRRRRK
jgi:preprotein translocase subunit SecA